jgi:hypothetical protein
MNKELKAIVLPIANDVRAWAEAKAVKRDGYRAATDLCCWCAIASAELHRRLTASEVVAELHMAQDSMGCHVYVVVDDHVVDVTATQFMGNHPKVVLKHMREAEAKWYWQTADVFLNAVELRKHQQRTKWPSSQIALARASR